MPTMKESSTLKLTASNDFMLFLLEKGGVLHYCPKPCVHGSQFLRSTMFTQATDITSRPGEQQANELAVLTNTSAVAVYQVGPAGMMRTKSATEASDFKTFATKNQGVGFSHSLRYGSKKCQTDVLSANAVCDSIQYGVDNAVTADIRCACASGYSGSPYALDGCVREMSN